MQFFGVVVALTQHLVQFSVKHMLLYGDLVSYLKNIRASRFACFFQLEHFIFTLPEKLELPVPLLWSVLAFEH